MAADPPPTDLLLTIAALREMVAAKDAALTAALAGLKTKALEIEKLKLQVARLRRHRFGQSSEKLGRTADQLELALEELETAEAEQPAAAGTGETDGEAAEPAARRPRRKPLPETLPREEVVHDPESGTCDCPRCGGQLRRLGEDRAKVLEYEPGRYKVVEHVRPKFSCRSCESITQAPASLPIAHGRLGPGLLAHILVSKFDDHLPLYRQTEIFARHGIDLSRSTLADQVGHVFGLLRPLIEALERDVIGSAKLHGDDTPVPVLAPGTGKTKTGYLWAYVRDDRPCGGPAPPAVLYRYSPGRSGEYPRSHLKDFRGFLQADGYAGFGDLYRPGADGRASVIEVACMAHVRRKFYDIAENAKTKAPIATEALERIKPLYRIEAEM